VWETSRFVVEETGIVMQQHFTRQRTQKEKDSSTTGEWIVSLEHSLSISTEKGQEIWKKDSSHRQRKRFERETKIYRHSFFSVNT
jgi:hypothetical protein